MKALLQALHDGGYAPRQVGNSEEWSVKCPAHDDNVRSVSLKESDDGKTLVHCHAGCTPESIIAAFGLPWRIMFEDGEVDDLAPRQPRREPAPKPVIGQSNVMPIRKGIKPPDRLLRYKGELPSHTYWYRNEQGQPLLACCRWNPDGERKRVRHLTMHKVDRFYQWRMGDLPDPRPMYGLDRMAAEPGKPIIITEGEKAADAAHGRLNGYVGMCWLGGAAAVEKADWRPIARAIADGRDVILWPDADEAGVRCMDALSIYLPGARLVEVIPWLAGGLDLADDMPEHVDIQAMLDQAWTPTRWDRAWLLGGGCIFRPWDSRYRGPFRGGFLPENKLENLKISSGIDE